MALRVDYAPQANADFLAIIDLIVRDAGIPRARSYVARIRQRCEVLAVFPHAGREAPEFANGVRVLGFERRVLIAYRVEAEAVLILRVLYGGRDLSAP